MFKRVSILVFVLVMIAVGVFVPSIVESFQSASGGKRMEIRLSRGNFTVFDFSSRKQKTSALLIFGSGDGGWNAFEEAIARTFQDQGYKVVGIDFCAYAATGYDLATLQSDYGKIAQAGLASFGNHPIPLIVGGYSMGAAQAVAAAGGPHPPPGLIGLLLIDPLSRGRYGLQPSDQMNVLPEGPGTFSTESFSGTMGALRIVQWHAEEDPFDSSSWLRSLSAPYKIFTFPNTGHSYSNDREEFVHRLVESARWILNPTPDNTAAGKIGGNP